MLIYVCTYPYITGKYAQHRKTEEQNIQTWYIFQLVAVVDDVYTDHSHIAGKFTMLSSSRVYVGGAVNPRALLGARVHNNFVGCLRKVNIFIHHVDKGVNH